MRRHHVRWSVLVSRYMLQEQGEKRGSEKTSLSVGFVARGPS